MALTKGPKKKRRRGDPDTFRRFNRERFILDQKEQRRRFRKELRKRMFKDFKRLAPPGMKNPFDGVK